jgi:hypothetical protein
LLPTVLKEIGDALLFEKERYACIVELTGKKWQKLVICQKCRENIEQGKTHCS